MTLSKTPSSVAGLSSTSTTIASVFADVRQQSQIVINFRPLHGQQIPVFPLKYSTLAAVAECVGGRNKSMHLNGLDQFALRRDLGVGFLGFEHPI